MYHHYMVHNTQYPLTSRSLNRFSNINAFADVAYSYQISSSRHAVPTCRVCASCSCGEAIPRVSSRGGLLVAPSVRHPKGEMHSAKTFCVPQNFRLRPSPAALPLLPLPFAARELTRRWTTITTGENQDAHTKRQRQNRRSRIFQEDRGKPVSYTILVAEQKKTQMRKPTFWSSAALLS